MQATTNAINRPLITPAAFYKGRDIELGAGFTPVIQSNSERTMRAANAGLSLFYDDVPHAADRNVNSGLRTPAGNSAAGGAPLSGHMRGLCIDLSDSDARELALWSLRNQARLRTCGIQAMERPEACIKRHDDGRLEYWVHWQTYSPGSGVFVFWPTDAALTAWRKSGDPLLVA